MQRVDPLVANFNNIMREVNSNRAQNEHKNYMNKLRAMIKNNLRVRASKTKSVSNNSGLPTTEYINRLRNMIKNNLKTRSLQRNNRRTRKARKTRKN
jgi:hypothetical protein